MGVDGGLGRHVTVGVGLYRLWGGGFGRDNGGLSRRAASQATTTRSTMVTEAGWTRTQFNRSFAVSATTTSRQIHPRQWMARPTATRVSSAWVLKFSKAVAHASSQTTTLIPMASAKPLTDDRPLAR